MGGTTAHWHPCAQLSGLQAQGSAPKCDIKVFAVCVCVCGGGGRNPNTSHDTLQGNDGTGIQKASFEGFGIGVVKVGAKSIATFSVFFMCI